jgi:hypothetical protein
MPVRRLLNVAKLLWLQQYPRDAWDELRLLLAWPEEVEAANEATRVREANEREQEMADSMAMSAATIGFNPEKMWDRAVRARAAGLEELRRRAEAAEAEGEA